MEQFKNKIIYGNCVDNLRKLDSNIIDLVVTSPPYDELRDYNGYEFELTNIPLNLTFKMKAFIFMIQ